MFHMLRIPEIPGDGAPLVVDVMLPAEFRVAARRGRTELSSQRPVGDVPRARPERVADGVRGQAEASFFEIVLGTLGVVAGSGHGGRGNGPRPLFSANNTFGVLKTCQAYAVTGAYRFAVGAGHILNCFHDLSPLN